MGWGRVLRDKVLVWKSLRCQKGLLFDLQRGYREVWRNWQIFARRQCPISRNIGAVIAFVHCAQKLCKFRRELEMVIADDGFISVDQIETKNPLGQVRDGESRM